MIKQIFTLGLLALAVNTWADSPEYTAVGSTIVKSTDGSKYRAIGDTTNGPNVDRKRSPKTPEQAASASADLNADRSSSQRIGDSKYRADGVTCQEVAGTTVCN